MHRLSHLANGLTLATVELPHLSSVSLGLWVAVGGRHEPEPVCGVSHFIEHMLFKGTRRRTARMISEAVEGVGGYLNAFTAEENTCFYARASHSRLNELWDVLADMFLHSTFDATEVEKERSVIKEEAAMYRDLPQHYVQELLDETVWPNHPLGRPLSGTDESLTALRREDMVRYMRSYYGGGTTVIAAAGAIRHSELERLVRKRAAKFAPCPRPICQPAAESQREPRVRLHTRAVEQTQLALGIRTCSRHDPRRYALRVLSAILGENMSSRLFQTIREDRGLAYSISSGTAFFEDTGVLNISAGLDTDKLPQVVGLIGAELVRIGRERPSAAEVRRARDYLLGQFDLSMENTENQMNWLGEQYLGYGKIFTPAEMKAQLAKVTPAHVRDTARALFQPDRMNLALVSPLQTPRGLDRALRKIAA
jgi:predicted Zn-dependent peptidase